MLRVGWRWRLPRPCGGQLPTPRRAQRRRRAPQSMPSTPMFKRRRLPTRGSNARKRPTQPPAAQLEILPRRLPQPVRSPLQISPQPPLPVTAACLPRQPDGLGRGCYNARNI